MSLTFGGTAYPIAPDDFNVGTVDAKGKMCLGAVFAVDSATSSSGSSSSSSPSWIIGDSFLKNVYTVFRLTPTPAAVGFATPASGYQSLLRSAGEASGALSGTSTTTTNARSDGIRTSPPLVAWLSIVGFLAAVFVL